MKTVLKFYSPTCGPCKVMSKNLESIDDIEVVDVDINDDKNAELVDMYKVRSVPSIVILTGEGGIKHSGVLTVDKLKELL